MYRTVEDIKDIFAVTFGVERKRDIQTEYDLGIRQYPWVCYKSSTSGGGGSGGDPSNSAEEKIVYRNNDTGLITEIKPADWDVRALPSSYLVLNTDASAIAIVPDNVSKTGWEKHFQGIAASPIIQGAFTAGRAVAASPVGQAVSKVTDKVKDVQDKISESWDTSQHPLVVNSSHIVDSLITETETGKAMREMRLLDSGFDEYMFMTEMRDTFLPKLVRAYLRYDEPLLKEMGGEVTVAQAKAAQAGREGGSGGNGAASNGGTTNEQHGKPLPNNITYSNRHDGIVLSVSRVEVVQAKSLEQGVPVLVLSGLAQYIHTIRSKDVSKPSLSSSFYFVPLYPSLFCLLFSSLS